MSTLLVNEPMITFGGRGRGHEGCERNVESKTKPSTFKLKIEPDANKCRGYLHTQAERQEVVENVWRREEIESSAEDANRDSLLKHKTRSRTCQPIDRDFMKPTGEQLL